MIEVEGVVWKRKKKTGRPGWKGAASQKTNGFQCSGSLDDWTLCAEVDWALEGGTGGLRVLFECSFSSPKDSSWLKSGIWCLTGEPRGTYDRRRGYGEGAISVSSRSCCGSDLGRGSRVMHRRAWVRSPSVRVSLPCDGSF